MVFRHGSPPVPAVMLVVALFLGVAGGATANASLARVLLLASIGIAAVALLLSMRFKTSPWNSRARKAALARRVRSGR